MNECIFINMNIALTLVWTTKGEQTPTNKMIQFVEIERLKTMAINLGQMNLDFVILELFMV